MVNTEFDFLPADVLLHQIKAKDPRLILFHVFHFQSQGSYRDLVNHGGLAYCQSSCQSSPCLSWALMGLLITELNSVHLTQQDWLGRWQGEEEGIA